MHPAIGWQWWHPEWGAEFWTRDADPAGVQRVEVHAMIDLDEAAGTQPHAPAFDANGVVGDLTRVPNVGPEHAHP